MLITEADFQGVECFCIALGTVTNYIPMPRQEFSLCERVYIHNMYMKSRESYSETRRKFRVKFPGRPVPNPSAIRIQAKRFKETGSVKNRKVNRRRYVLTEETLDEIGERN